MNQLKLRERVVDIGVDLSLVYHRVCNDASTMGYMKEMPFPKFEELFDEYVDISLNEKTLMSKGEIESELGELVRIRENGDDPFSVENGFRPEHFGISKEAEFLNALLAANFVFILHGTLMNAPILEVW